MAVSDAKRLKALEEESSKLKRLRADYLLDDAALKDVVSRKWSARKHVEKRSPF